VWLDRASRSLRPGAGTEASPTQEVGT